MMVAFSVSDTATAGFGLIRRQPLAVVGWGLFMFVSTVAPIAAGVAWLIHYVGGLHQITETRDLSDGEVFAVILPLWLGILSFYALMVLGTMVGQAVVISAVFRAVLEPGRKAFAYLRLGAQELWVGMSLLVANFLFGVVIGIAWIPVVIVCALLAAADYEVAAGIVGVVGGIALAVGIVWLMLRLSMAAPLSFAERRFAFFESWNLTKGQSGRLFLTALLTFLFIILVEVAVAIVFLIVLFATGGIAYLSAGSISDASDWTPQQVLAVLGPLLGAVAIVYTLFVGAILAISLAPWAAAYKSLAAGMVREPGVA